MSINTEYWHLSFHVYLRTTLEIRKRKFGRICSNIRTWKSMEIRGNYKVYMDIHGNLLLYVDVHGNSGVRGNPWICRISVKFPRTSMYTRIFW